MTKLALPVVDPARTEFGFSRTVCACQECTLNCQHIPGYLIPADLERIQQYLAPAADIFIWAEQHLLASPGAKVMQQDKVFRIPTLVPARHSNGTCTFLTTENRCSIHAVAPFGCSFFDAHQSRAESDRRSQRGLQAIMEAWSRLDLYALVWVALDLAGLQASAPEVCRQKLQQARNQDNAS
jgi:Fe-S-cluster containining protein